MLKNLLACLFALLAPYSLWAANLHIGPGQSYPNLTAAVAVAKPGDTLLLHTAIYTGGLLITNLKGNENQWITIKNAPNANPVFEGGSNAIQFVEPAYLHLAGLVFQHQTGNGVNTDDGGTYITPAHHLVFEKCTFRDMSATGNNDLLKLSGLDFFEVRNCLFLNGAAGGSGIDMVGCHHGLIIGNHFENMGSNAIQCKGGSEHIRIEGNFFKKAGQRALNLGGSTGLAFFRPDTAHFEAANLQVFSNIIIGSEAPIAYVGAVRVDVINNTIYQPEKWVTRILQETVDPSRFLACGDNSFQNNIVFLGKNVGTATNIGPNTRPESFVFSNNLWFNADNANWGGPFLPVPESNQILNANPLLAAPATGDFGIPMNSPAAGAGKSVANAPAKDFLGKWFAQPPSVGAIEARPLSQVQAPSDASIIVFPNPAGPCVHVRFEPAATSKYDMQLFDFQGKMIKIIVLDTNTGSFVEGTIDLQDLPNGLYLLGIFAQGRCIGRRLVAKKED